jgi:hypothetical protein
MLKPLLAAVAVSLPLMFGGATSAQADVDVDFFFGFPHYDYRVGPEYRFRRGYGWYDPGYVRRYERFSCRQGARFLEREGYDVIRSLDCDGRTYVYRVENDDGRRITIALNSRTREYRRIRR